MIALAINCYYIDKREKFLIKLCYKLGHTESKKS